MGKKYSNKKIGKMLREALILEVERGYDARKAAGVVEEKISEISEVLRELSGEPDPAESNQSAQEMIRLLGVTIKLLGGDSRIQAAVGSFRDTMDDDWCIAEVERWNALVASELASTGQVKTTPVDCRLKAYANFLSWKGKQNVES